MDETKSQVALPPDIENGQRIAAALAGDADAMSALYGIAAMLIRKGLAIPEPLATAIADRLDALAHAARVTSPGDYRRDALAAAAAPGRKAGQPKKKFTERDYEIAGAIVATEHVGSIDERIEAAAERAAKALHGPSPTKEELTRVTTEVRRGIATLNKRGLGKGMAGKKN